jgi:tetratricopeptide (TPR) repeat protein
VTEPSRDLPARPSRRERIAAVALALVVIVPAAFFAWRWYAPRVAAPPSGHAAPAAAPTFVGTAVCGACHAKERAAWHGSDHDLAMQVAGDESVLGDFANAKFAYAGTTSTFSRRDGRYYVNTDGPDGKRADFEIKYTFGVRPLQQYLIELPGGRLQALGIAWDSRPKADGGQRWFHLYPGENLKAGDPLHWTGVQQNWNYQCAECHSTNLRKNYDPQTNTFKTAWSELSVGCEACHGPGSRHVAWARKEGDGAAYGAGKGLVLALDERRGVTWTPDPTTGNSKRSAPRASAREIEMCARCHARAGRITDDYVYGAPPLDSHRLATLEENLYFDDGQMRDEVYNWGSFVQSAMYAHGVTCSDCHDPHSLKLRAAGNAVCSQCHAPAKYDNAGHTHHKEGTAAAACPACHMPATTYMVVDPRHDHSFRIPRPDLSVKLGTPNACNGCHAKQSAQWAAAAIESWTGRPPHGFQTYAEALHLGSTGAPGARGALLAVIDDKAQPAIARASAIERLGPLLTPATLPAVTRALNDPDPLVRTAAVAALGDAEAAVRHQYLTRMLDDPVKSVRLGAARALAGEPEHELTPAEQARFAAVLAELVAAYRYDADRPEGRLGLGNLYAARGDAGGAIAEYRKAIELDPTFVAAYANLADLHRIRGAETDAEAVLRQGAARNPRSAALQFALGLNLVRQKRQADGLKALAEASRLAPDDAHFAYVYSVALKDSGKTGEALKVLSAANKRHPYDRDLLTGLAYFSAQDGRDAAALAYAQTLHDLDPENPRYAQLLQQLRDVRAR